MMRLVSTLILLFTLAATVLLTTDTRAYASYPTTTDYSLPACETEDGAGVALCWWDAQTMGNGMGTSVISGDCAPDYVGSMDISALCVRLYAMPASEYTYQDATITMPNGAALAQECTEEWNMMDEAMAQAEGFTLEECFKAQMGE